MKESKKNAKRKWLPIFDETESGEILSILHHLARVLQHPPPAWVPAEGTLAEPYRIVRGASLAHGSAGIALFYTYFHTYLSELTAPPGNPPWADEADRFISHACDVLGSTPMQGGLYRGLSGIAWTVQHLQGLLYHDGSGHPDSDPNEEIDKLLTSHFARTGKFDAWEGCVGLGVYALERHPYGDSTGLLEIIIDQLNRLAVHSPKGISWFSDPRQLSGRTRSFYPQGFYSLGAAHGIAGVISFLSRVLSLGILPEVTSKLLDGAVSWLMNQRRKELSPLLFPQFLLPPDNKNFSTRTFGWCHGDLGIAAALTAAAVNCGESIWKEVSVKAAHGAAHYLNGLAGQQGFDPCLCHGTAGFGHLFNRIYQATGIEDFKEQARKWFLETSGLRETGKGIAGFNYFGINEDGEISELYDPGFIQGASGTGLALLAAISGLEPVWDRVMLI